MVNDRIRYIDNTDEMIEALRRAVKRALKDSADRIVEHAIAKVPIKDGDLMRSIDAGNPIEDGMSISVEFGAYSGHAAPIEYGTAGRGEPFVQPEGVDRSYWPSVPPGKKRYGPYPIRPKNGQFLRWEDETGVHYAREVWHPGIRPQPFMRPAIDTVRNEEFKKIMRDSISREMRRFRYRR